MRSKAEKFVVGHVENKDAVVRGEACKILAAIGSKQSKAALDKASGDRNSSLAGAGRVTRP